MAESMAQGFVGGPGSQFPYSFMGATPEQVQAFHHALAANGVAPEMQQFLQHSVSQVRAQKPTDPESWYFCTWVRGAAGEAWCSIYVASMDPVLRPNAW